MKSYTNRQFKGRNNATSLLQLLALGTELWSTTWHVTRILETDISLTSKAILKTYIRINFRYFNRGFIPVNHSWGKLSKYTAAKLFFLHNIELILLFIQIALQIYFYVHNSFLKSPASFPCIKIKLQPQTIRSKIIRYNFLIHETLKLSTFFKWKINLPWNSNTVGIGILARDRFFQFVQTTSLLKFFN